MTSPASPVNEASGLRPLDPPLPAVAAARLCGDRSVETMATYAIHAALELDLLTALGREPADPATLAGELGVDADALYRLLRALESLDIVVQHDGIFAPGQMAPYAYGGSVGDRDPAKPLEWGWAALADAVRTGVPAFDSVHGMPLFEYLDRHPETAERFHARMRERGEQRNAVIADTYSFAGFATIVDVGGGTGDLLARIVQRHPSARGVLFDQPAVIDRAGESLHGLSADRIGLVAGDMFASVPRGGDAYLLSSILHDWDDETAARILRNVHEAMSPAATLLIVEMVLPDDLRDARLKLLDLEMLALTGGRERTRNEYAALLGRAGFAVESITPTESLYSVLAACRA